MLNIIISDDIMDDKEVVIMGFWVGYVDCSDCGQKYHISICEELGRDDFVNKRCHHCLNYEGEVTEETFELLCDLEKQGETNER